MPFLIPNEVLVYLIGNMPDGYAQTTNGKIRMHPLSLAAITILILYGSAIGQEIAEET